MNARRSTGRGPHRFGGDWTTAKLDVIASSLKSYTTALRDKPSKEHPFVKGYIDAFAGTGYRDAGRGDRTEHASQALLLPDLAGAEPQALRDGSARLALKTQPRFDRYVFIERSPDRCAQLELLKQEFPDLANDVQIRRGDANDEIQELCARDWSSHRAVLFLDPYGMQVDLDGRQRGERQVPIQDRQPSLHQRARQILVVGASAGSADESQPV